MPWRCNPQILLFLRIPQYDYEERQHTCDPVTSVSLLATVFTAVRSAMIVTFARFEAAGDLFAEDFEATHGTIHCTSVGKIWPATRRGHAKRHQ